MASLYNGNVMKSIVTISSACALAFAGMASAQDAPAPAPAAETPAAPVAPAAEVSKEAKEAADQMLALMKEMSATLSTVKDKATADAAAEKMAKINEKGEALSKSAQKVQAEMDAAMQEGLIVPLDAEKGVFTSQIHLLDELSLQSVSRDILATGTVLHQVTPKVRSEERRVGKE